MFTIIWDTHIYMLTHDRKDDIVKVYKCDTVRLKKSKPA